MFGAILQFCNNSAPVLEAERVLTLARLTAAATLEGEEVGVVTVAPQAEVRPADGFPLVQMQHHLTLGQLHHPRAQLHPFIIHVCHLEGERARVSREPRKSEPLGGAVSCRARPGDPAALSCTTGTLAPLGHTEQHHGS